MNKLLLFFVAVIFLSCGEETYPLLLKVEQLRDSKEASLQDFVSIHEHTAILNELLQVEVPKGIKIPQNTDCSSFTLNEIEFDQLEGQCQSSFFDICPRGFSEYRVLSNNFIKICEELKDKE